LLGEPELEALAAPEPAPLADELPPAPELAEPAPAPIPEAEDPDCKCLEGLKRKL